MAGDRVYTADMGQPPMDPEVAPPTSKVKTKAKKAPPPPKMKDYPAQTEVWTEKSGIPVPKEPEGAKAKGGYVKAADGIAKRGKTRGVMVACGGGYMKGKK